MNIQELIEQTEENGFTWAAEEMRYYYHNPDTFREGQMVPNFDTVDELEIMHFYLGVAFGAGMQAKSEKL